MKKISPVIIVGLLLTILCLTLFVLGPAFIRTISNYAYDTFLKQVAQPPQSGKIVIVDLNDTSLQTVGQWPWPRYIVADLSRRILEAGASVVAFDIVFAEPDRTSPAQFRERMDKDFKLNITLEGIPEEFADFDLLLAEELKKGKTILGCELHPVDNIVKEIDASIPPLDTSCYKAVGRGNVEDYLMQSDDITVSIPELRKASSTAFFNASPDSDNIVRSNPLIWSLGPDRLYPALGLEAVRMHLDIPQCVVNHDEQGIVLLRLRNHIIPVDNAGRLVVNYRTVNKSASTGFVSSFPVYSALDVLNGKTGRSAFNNKIVFIGTSAIGLKDIKATPLSEAFSGVEVHATIADNILAGDMLWNPSYMVGAHSVSILIIGIFLTILIQKSRSWLSFLVSIALVLLAIKISFSALDRYHVVFVPAWEIVSIAIIYPVLTMLKFWEEELQKKRVRSMFGTMVSEDVLQYLENNPGSFSLTGQKTEATMFFSDVAGFTTISETLEPAKLSELLNRYLSPMTQIIMSRGGYVDKYEGDSIMAEWGVPFPTEDHALQACLAALEQQRELAELRQWLKKAFGHNIHVRMGINSGTVTAGNMGSDRRFQYTVMGDAVNQASRLEPVNKDYGTQIIIGESTSTAAQNAIEVRLLDKVIVKGKTKPTAIYELLSEKGKTPPKKLQVVSLYEEALRLHWERKWDQAIKQLDHALELDPSDGPSDRIRERIEGYRITPPPDNWAGEYVRLTKD
jgi:adenylate cyclase